VEGVQERPDGSQRVRLAVAAEAWFERLLVGLGPQATVVDAPAPLRDAGRRASARILDRYR
jgi:predicted DNA-binding transcriptional regulator YafY